MWPFNKRTENFDAKADIVAPLLMDCCKEAAPTFLKTLVGEDKADAQSEHLVPLTIELLIFALHLTDRITFGRLGGDSRSSFMDALLPRVQGMLYPHFHGNFQEQYNLRNSFYGGFRKFYPEKNENLENTLFWEFSKATGTIYSKSNPAAIMLMVGDSMNFMSTINELLTKANVI